MIGRYQEVSFLESSSPNIFLRINLGAFSGHGDAPFHSPKITVYILILCTWLVSLQSLVQYTYKSLEMEFCMLKFLALFTLCIRCSVIWYAIPDFWSSFASSVSQIKTVLQSIYWVSFLSQNAVIVFLLFHSFFTYIIYIYTCTMWNIKYIKHRKQKLYLFFD